ncbi:beta-fructofuranosidase, insoluble isoenzyme 1-like isoform X2 [Impatiens glandulifera]|uniref:beta-fructofuranosidase, insoluble isoenzyme 1-like isoform X2 n=1 Tax=Impatiens glandulifera TaxID=253017 RepID=UPI001FB0DF8E|nr:beta-fructofuranosidase, insoluble isoenzyme 1-like isoform X2 [Impatiens glandulifera]
MSAPMYYKGIYHIFYQYNPKGAVWGNIVWAHAVSKDLISWKILKKPAIFPSKSFDKYGTWSGSGTIGPDNKPIIFYTGVIDTKQTQVQAYAVPKDLSDPYLSTWVRPERGNPIAMVSDDLGVNKTAYRDPSTAWLGRDGQWRMLVGSRWNKKGFAVLYRSKDFKKWVQAKRFFHFNSKLGMFECPDFYPVSISHKNGLDNSVTNQPVKYVFKVSLDLERYDYYTLGSYNLRKDIYVPDKSSIEGFKALRYDYGNFYASKSFFDPSKNRRIVWGWANESDSSADDVSKGWSGIYAIPRKVWLDMPSGKQLMQWPVEELETLRGRKVEMSYQHVNKGEHIEIKGVTAAQADVEVKFSFSSLEKADKFDPKWDKWDAEGLCKHLGINNHGGIGPFGLLTLASSKLEEFTPVFFRIFKTHGNKHKVLMCSDARSSSLRQGDELYKPAFGGFVNVDMINNEISLRSLIDNSMIESFGAGGRTCIVSRVYPTLAVKRNAHLYVFNYGSEPLIIKSLNAWSMKAAKPMM